MFKNEESKPVIFNSQRLMKVDCIGCEYMKVIYLNCGYKDMNMKVIFAVMNTT